MATTQLFHDYILEHLSCVGPVTTRKMMGEYCVYYRGKMIGDICDNCLLLKITPSSERLLAKAEKAYPYQGAKSLMLVVDDVENIELMTELLNSMYVELPEPKKKVSCF